MVEVKKFLIIDANAVLHRAYHALPPLNTKQGELVNAVYGFLLVLFKALKDIKPNYAAACFDLKAPTFRHEQFKDYKAKRKKAPDELYQQIARIKQALNVFGIPIFEKQGFEADDLIGTLACRAPKKQVLDKIEAVILSGDLDNLQLVDDDIKVYALVKGIKDTVLYDTEKVKEKYQGLLPSQLVDFRGLRGDASDNIPGVKGIGEKTAIELLKTFSSLENIYQAVENNTKEAKKIKPAILEKLKTQKEQAFLSRQLAQIRCDAPIKLDLNNCAFGSFDLAKAKAFLFDLNFYSLINKIPHQANQEPGLLEPRPLIKQATFLFSAVRKTGELGKEKVNTLISEIEGLEKQGIFSKEIAQVEKDLVSVVQKMEQTGIKVNEKKLKMLSFKLAEKIKDLEKEIYKKADVVFNLNSPKQVSEVLFERHRIPTVGLRKTPKGVISTGVEELNKLRKSSALVDLLLNYRELFKLKSGFVDALPKTISQDSRIHPIFNQLGTETGRMSCQNPNLQNIPIKGELGKAIRECFVPGEGYDFLSADYSQVELRVAAEISGDKIMSEFFKQGKDIHIMTASKIFHIAENDISKEQRQLAKTLNFAIMYGMGPVSLAERSGINRKQAKEFIKSYFEEFSGIANYVKNAKQSAKETGFSQTLFGRKRFLSEINSLDPRLRAQAERIAVNLGVQGTAADIMKTAMVEIARQGLLDEDCRLLLQIHDELLFEVKKEKIKETAQAIKKIMENVVALKVPLMVEIEVGKNWGEMEKI